MLTPQEARENANFEKAVFGGYSMSSVDDYVLPLIEDYSALYKENAVLKSKMKVLVDRMEEYRKQEEGLNKTLMAAQKTADDMVAKTERDCARMIADTEQALRVRNQDLQAELAAEAERVARAKKTAFVYISEIENQLKLTVEQLEKVRQMAIPARNPEKPQEEAAPAAPSVPETPRPSPVDMSREIEENLSKILGGELEHAVSEQETQSGSGDTRVIPTVSL